MSQHICQLTLNQGLSTLPQALLRLTYPTVRAAMPCLRCAESKFLIGREPEEFDIEALAKTGNTTVALLGLGRGGG